MVDGRVEPVRVHGHGAQGALRDVDDVGPSHLAHHASTARAVVCAAEPVGVDAHAGEAEEPQTRADGPGVVLDATALGRAGDPDDIAATVAWLALEAPYITGQILAVDGGRSLALQGS